MGLERLEIRVLREISLEGIPDELIEADLSRRVAGGRLKG